MRVLFLDIDGVLNSERSCAAFDGYPHDFTAKAMGMFDMVAVALIRKLCHKTDCSIVLSSTWRITSAPHEVANGLDLPVMDKTPVLNGPRGIEIAAWLNEHPEVTKYAIVDDNSDMLPDQMCRFVQTNFQTGLSLDDYRQLKHLLRKEP